MLSGFAKYANRFSPAGPGSGETEYRSLLDGNDCYLSWIAAIWEKGLFSLRFAVKEGENRLVSGARHSRRLELVCQLGRLSLR